MDNLQYLEIIQNKGGSIMLSFKPYYKWITFNMLEQLNLDMITRHVLNLIING